MQQRRHRQLLAGLLFLSPSACYGLIPPSPPYTKVVLTALDRWNTETLSLSHRTKPLERKLSKSRLLSAVDSVEQSEEEATIMTPSTDINNLHEAITTYLNEATTANSKEDFILQRNAVDNAERLLNQWVELSRGGKSITDGNKVGDDTNNNNNVVIIPPADVFQNVIQGFLSLPSSIQQIQKELEGEKEELSEQNQIKSLLGKRTKGELSTSMNTIANNQNNLPPQLAIRILDAMEAYHEPTPEVYDAVIAAFGKCALEYLSLIHSDTIMSDDDDDDDDENEHDDRSSQYSLYYSQAWKSAKAALQLLNRSEDLYHETGKSSYRLPGVSSYATVMDVYKALAVNSADLVLEEDSKKKNRDEALNVWKNVHQRRLEMFRLDEDAIMDDGREGSRYSILPGEVTRSVEDTFEYAYNLLCESSPSYADQNSEVGSNRKIGTYHFNQLIFGLAEYPQTFSGLLAQDLLEFMITRVSSTPLNERRNNPNVPKPNVETINGVLKAWMVTPNYPDAVARRVESILAKLAGWQSDGTLWGVTPDTVSYNTCINCWKKSGIPGAAERATEILVLMEDKSTNILPDAISYCSCISAWAQCAAMNPNAGANAEAILTRMHSRGKENDDAPKPTTRCFNAVLLAYANGKQKGGGKRALELLRFSK